MNRGQLPTNSYLPVIGVHSTMHLVHPNYWQITIICVIVHTIINFVNLHDQGIQLHTKYSVCMCKSYTFGKYIIVICQ